MSIVVCIPGTNCIYFASDGVAYDEDGTILGMASKVLPVAAGSSVLAWVGAGAFGPAIASQIGPTICTFDDLLDHVVGFGRNAIDHLKNVDKRWHASGTAVVAGWSESDGAYRAYTFSSYPKEQMLAGEPVTKVAWELQRLDGMYLSTIPSETHLQQAGILDFYNDDTTPIDELAVRVVCAARLASREFAPGEEPVPGSSMTHFAAGGFVQVTFFEKDCLTQRIVHRWPDQVGERVNPSTGEQLPRFLMESTSGGESDAEAEAQG